MNLLLRCFLLLVTWTLCSCAPPPPPSAEDYLPSKKLKIVTTSVQLAELAIQIGGDAVTVECMLTPHASSRPLGDQGKNATWQPNPFKINLRAADWFAMQTAHLVLLNGLGLENNLESDVANLRAKGVPVVVVGDSIPEADRLNLPNTNTVDPSYWNSPRLWQHAVNAVTAGLQKLVRPEASAYFEYRASPVRQRLKRMAEWGESILRAAKPPGQRFVLTSHDTLGYFARDFALETRALWHAADGSPAATDAELLVWLEQHHVSDILMDASSPPDLSLDDLSVRFGVTVAKPIYTIYPDRPGTMLPGKMESHDVGTYEGMFRQLIRMLEHRMGGTRAAALPDPQVQITPPDRVNPSAP